MAHNDCILTVYCLAYNHEKYIKQTLDGFVSQKTNYKYKVIVHDDASTDRTPNIIKEYSELYPDLIVPVLQNVNQYSQGIDIFEKFILPLSEGKYIASCEGDDYWCDNYKLQRQISFLENNPDYSACVHNTVFLNSQTNEEIVYYDSNNDKDLSVSDLIPGGGCCFHTSSIMYRKDYASIPKEFVVFGVGDYQKGLYLATKGKIKYFKEVGSVYRQFVQGSWSLRHIDNIVRDNNNIINMLTNFDIYTNQKYHAQISVRIDELNVESLEKQHKYREIIKKYSYILYKRKIIDIIKMYIKAIIRNEA